MEKVEVAVVGAGVIGLAVARSLALLGKEVLVLERAASFGTETSSRNSEVVHGGLYYPTNSLKAQFCVEGRHLLYEYCRERRIFCKAIGKLVVATDAPQQQATLHVLKQQSIANGYGNVRLLTEHDVNAMEPNVQARGGALWSPETGIVDAHNLMLQLLGDAEAHGASVAYHAGVERGSGIHKDAIQLSAGGIILSCQRVINCAGLWAGHVASMLHSSAAHWWTPPQQYFAKGNYFRLQRTNSPFRHLIYPVPDDTRGGLGVHATLDGNLVTKFGPDVEWLPVDITPDEIDFTPYSKQQDDFYRAIRSSYWPDLPDGSLSPDYVGVRPKLVHPNTTQKNSNNKLPFQDFVIAGPRQHGVKGLFHLLGIESPGLTSSLAIANHVANRIDETTGG